jgi:hypothetical protein
LFVNKSGGNSDVEGAASAVENFGIVIVSKGGSCSSDGDDTFLSHRMDKYRI